MSVFGNYAKYYNLLYEDKDYKEEVQYIESLIKKFSKKDLCVEVKIFQIMSTSYCRIEF